MGQLIRRDGHTLVFYFYLLGVQYNGDLASRLCVSNRVGEQIGQDFFKAFLRRMDRALSLYAESKVDFFCLRNQLIRLADRRKALRQVKGLGVLFLLCKIQPGGILVLCQEKVQIKYALFSVELPC